MKLILSVFVCLLSVNTIIRFTLSSLSDLGNVEEVSGFGVCAVNLSFGNILESLFNALKDPHFYN